MAVNSIMSLSVGYFSYIQTDFEYEEIKRKLMALGLQVTGQKSVDKSRLEQALQEQELEKTQKTNTEEIEKTTQSTSSEEIPAELGIILKYLNVRESNNIETDYKYAINELRERFMNETDQAELTYLRDMKLRLDIIMQGLGYSTLNITASEMMGASTLSDMNKVMMIGNNSSTSTNN